MPRGYRLSNYAPGALPDIRPSGDGIEYVMTPPGARPGKQLVIRCDGNGDAWVSIRPQPFGEASASAACPSLPGRNDTVCRRRAL